MKPRHGSASEHGAAERCHERAAEPRCRTPAFNADGPPRRPPRAGVARNDHSNESAAACAVRRCVVADVIRRRERRRPSCSGPRLRKTPFRRLIMDAPLPGRGGWRPIPDDLVADDAGLRVAALQPNYLTLLAFRASVEFGRRVDHPRGQRLRIGPGSTRDRSRPTTSRVPAETPRRRPSGRSVMVVPEICRRLPPRCRVIAVRLDETVDGDHRARVDPMPTPVLPITVVF